MPLTQVSSRLIEDTLRYVLGASGTDQYTFTGKGLNGAVNDPTLTLSRGHTYIFENRSGGHPFYIKTSIANGGTNDAYNTGVTNNGVGNGTEIVFTVPHDAPDTLYYQCSSHSSMAGQLNIAGSVADGSITESKLADDAVTADKLANSINTAIAANTAKDLTALSASNLTSGTVPDARFPATLPAASAANLTSIPAANITGTLPAISGANLTGITAGITVFTRFRLTSALTGNQDPITSNFGTADDGGRGTIGTAVSQSSGIFTFPTTGIYKIEANWSLINSSSNVTWCDMDILFAQDGTNYNAMARAVVGHSSGYYMQPVASLIVDVTDTSTAKVKFKAVFSNGNTQIRGSGTSDYTYFDFMRIGDT